MDPDVAYYKLCKHFSANEGPGGISYDEARELWQGLDEWLRHCGFLPAAWQEGREPLL